MKSIRIIAVLFLLIIFPLISYLYIRSGYFYRLNALKSLEPKTEISKFDYSSFSENEQFNLSNIKGHLTLLYNLENENAIGMITPMFQEYSHRSEFQMFGFGMDSTKISKYLENKIIPNKQWNIVKEQYRWDKEVTLIDTSGMVRNYYNFDSNDFKLLGQHIPIVMPRVKEQDIMMKGQKNN